MIHVEEAWNFQTNFALTSPRCGACLAQDLVRGHQPGLSDWLAIPLLLLLNGLSLSKLSAECLSL